MPPLLLPRLAAIAGLLALAGFAVQHRARMGDEPPPRTWTFPAPMLQGVKGITVRTARTATARIREHSGSALILSGRARLLPSGYHSPERRGEGHNFTWSLSRTGAFLILHSLGETGGRNGRWVLDDLEIQVPAGVPVKMEAQAVSLE